MIELSRAMEVWGTPDFEQALKQEIRKIDVSNLPLQAALTQSSAVAEGKIDVVILNISDTTEIVCARASIFYSGVNVGSCCADDPTPPCELTEYCELQFDINKDTAKTKVTLL